MPRLRSALIAFLGLFVFDLESTQLCLVDVVVGVWSLDLRPLKSLDMRQGRPWPLVAASPKLSASCAQARGSGSDGFLFASSGSLLVQLYKTSETGENQPESVTDFFCSTHRPKHISFVAQHGIADFIVGTRACMASQPQHDRHGERLQSI